MHIQKVNQIGDKNTKQNNKVVLYNIHISYLSQLNVK